MLVGIDLLSESGYVHGAGNDCAHDAGNGYAHGGEESGHPCPVIWGMREGGRVNGENEGSAER